MKTVTFLLMVIIACGTAACATSRHAKVERHLQSIRDLHDDRSLEQDAWHDLWQSRLTSLIELGHFGEYTIRFRHLDLDADIGAIMDTVEKITDAHPDWLGSIEVFDSVTGVEEKNERLVVIERPELCAEIEKALRSIDQKANKSLQATPQ
jgi:hypothetical protein